MNIPSRPLNWITNKAWRKIIGLRYSREPPGHLAVHRKLESKLSMNKTRLASRRFRSYYGFRSIIQRGIRSNRVSVAWEFIAENRAGWILTFSRGCRKFDGTLTRNTEAKILVTTLIWGTVRPGRREIYEVINPASERDLRPNTSSGGELVRR